jgi:hypothetical protein
MTLTARKSKRIRTLSPVVTAVPVRTLYTSFGQRTFDYLRCRAAFFDLIWSLLRRVPTSARRVRPTAQVPR